MEKAVAKLHHHGEFPQEAGKPEEILSVAQERARALKDLVSKKARPVVLNGEQYLEYEDWQTLARFFGYTVKTYNVIPVEINGVIGAKASADVIDRNGNVIGGAEAYCMRDEDMWNKRPKYEYRNGKKVKVGEVDVPWYQLASMAQTRAGAKALRNVLSWVVVLAGYKPTPAEEIIINDRAEESIEVPVEPVEKHTEEPVEKINAPIPEKKHDKSFEEKKIQESQIKAIFFLAREKLGLSDTDAVKSKISEILGKSIGSIKDLSYEDASAVINYFNKIKNK